MNLKTKVVIGALLFATLPVFIASALIGWSAIDSSKSALREQVTQKIISVRDTKKAQVEHYFDGIRNQMAFLSGSQMAIDAMLGLNDAFVNFRSEFDEQEFEFYKTELSAFYAKEVANEYKNRNAGPAFDWKQYLQKIDDDGIAFQYQYLKANPGKIGQKDEWIEPDDDTLYSQIHSMFHTQLKSFRDRFDYLDILLIDAATGRVIYSVSKQADFAASVINGPLANSGIGQVIKPLLNTTDAKQIIMQDFTAYAPAYNDQVAFIASPIFEEETLLGYMVFEMGSKGINNVMTTGGKWRDAGLGETGESYLVAKDLKARSISRNLVEKNEQYLQRISNSQSTEQADLIASKKSNVGLELIETQGSQAAIEGNTGLETFESVRGTMVISAYAPLAIAGVNWAILSEIEVSEALASAEILASKLTSSSSMVLIVVLIITAGLGWLLGTQVTKPIVNLEKYLCRVEKEADLTKDSEMSGDSDEVGRMAAALDGMLSKFRDSIHGVANASTLITGSAGELATVADTSQQNIQVEQENIVHLADAVSQMVATVKEVAQNASSTADAALHADQAASDGRDVVSKAINSIKQVAQQVEEAGGVIQKLEQDSQKIGSVLGVIEGIAEQTNLLALNAAIEAARAGEQGRGFAVVADEVRSLANRTHVSTKEIELMIQALQSGSKQAVAVMEQGTKQTQTTVTQANKVGETLNSIVSSVDSITAMSQQIATATQQQTEVANKLDESICNIKNQATKALEHAGSIATSSDSLAESAVQLDTLVAGFKV
ncbi:MAG: methyl-accepting chemotaxis protein [Gammaproteobacteria bacterium]|jgi:methyl-accepting chemotaxis protein|nr:methyl-accepting chemotaxis protein [Gammaproteobacteria bacterium]MBT3724369.1 methyl-accepting chemotaxis protein [Gammaproteobacteria bacterium]MBT4077021.1 methyl-accepting chemotaxis protein [Gammaproteobacteria bacterium]MBT4194054.1 methyl-accepting chemotaxis protein [Gammaproteobacteria bacterium]MBT4452073.1 methyl-accepting chemotaxis protein [Gammaproteobacteria bacterium]